MKKRKHLYNIIFWISRLFTIFVFTIWLVSVIHAKYILSERYCNIIIFFIEFLEKINDYFFDLLFNYNINGAVFYNFNLYIFGNFCKNSQSIDLLIIALILILVISIILIRYVKKENKYLLAVSIISSILYLTMYVIFKLPIMIALAVSTPIILLSIYILNKRCPIQEVIVLIPIVGEIFCIKKIIQYIFKNNSNKITNFSLLLTALIVSNVICFLFPYKTERDFENRIMKNETYSIKTYKDKMIISGNEELITIDKYDNNNYIKNNRLGIIEDFVIDRRKEELYIHNTYNDELLVLDMKTLSVMNKIVIDKNIYTPVRTCFNDDFSKLIVIYECSNVGCLIDLNKYRINYLNGISQQGDGLIYNNYRKCFLLSFFVKVPFLQEIDIEQKKIRKIKANKYQGYMAISERNKEIYIAFNQHGRIGIYDAETMKLKRKIRSNYTVKDITYDEELNVLIAPSYFTGYVDIFLMDGRDKLLTREFVGYELREGCFDSPKKNLYVCSPKGLYKKKIDINKLIENNSK